MTFLNTYFFFRLRIYIKTNTIRNHNLLPFFMRGGAIVDFAANDHRATPSANEA